MLLENNRTARRRALERDLERYKARSAFLLEKVERAESALAKATAAPNATEAALASAQRTWMAIEAECESIRQLVTFDPAIVDTLPSELLQAIWGHISTTSAYEARWKTLEYEDYSAARAMLPGRLAAVCRRWRHVALSTPELWTYVAIPDNLNYYTMKFDPIACRVQLQLERSQLLGLELFLLHRADTGREAYSYWSTCVLVVLHMASKHSQRWRSVTLRFPRIWKADFFAQLMMNRPTPMLEKLYVAGSEGMDVPWIPSAPSLIALGALDVRLCLPPGSTIRSVVSASFSLDSGSDQTLDRFWDVLRALPSLENLSLLLDDKFTLIDPPNLSESISLRSLVTLKLRSYFWDIEDLLLNNVVAPRLKKLNLEAGMVDEDSDWGHRFFATCPDISALELEESRITLPRIRTLSALKRLQWLSLIDCFYDPGLFRSMGLSSRGDVPSGRASPIDSDVSESDFEGRDECYSPSGLIWPELRSLTIFAPHGSDKDLLDDLLFIVRTRATVCSARGTPFELSLLSWPSPFPSWFREALGCLLGPAHVYLTTADGISHAPLANDDQQDETEAEFTDGSGSNDASSSDDVDYDRVDIHADEE